MLWNSSAGGACYVRVVHERQLIRKRFIGRQAFRQEDRTRDSSQIYTPAPLPLFCHGDDDNDGPPLLPKGTIRQQRHSRRWSGSPKTTASKDLKFKSATCQSDFLSIFSWDVVADDWLEDNRGWENPGNCTNVEQLLCRILNKPPTLLNLSLLKQNKYTEERS